MKTLRIPINEAVPGLVVADDIYSANNQLIISKGTVLNRKIITRLRFYLINELSIEADADKDQSKKETVKEDNYSQVIRNSAEFKRFNEEFLDSIHDFKTELNNIAYGEAPMDILKLLEHTAKILAESRNGIHVFDMLHCMREYDDLTYVHSINVGLICNVFGNWLKLPQSEINALTLSGLLHDIGKLKLPAHILNKPNVLTSAEYTLVKTHTVKGYQLLKNRNLDNHVMYSALMHHERCDGSGYPNAFHSSSIDPYAKIVAIADVYDAMTSARVYRPALSPFEAIRGFETEGLQKYDPRYLITFLEGIVQCYIGKRVRLSNYTEGTIVMINKHALAKPIIQVGERFIDLSKKPNLVIQALI